MLVIIFLVFLLAITVGLPVAFALSGFGTMIMFWQDIFNPFIIAQTIFSGNDSTPLIAILFFMLAGLLMEEARLTQRLMDFAYNIVGHLYGGIALVAVLVAMMFSAMTGSAVATSAAVGGMLLPVLRKKEYDEGFSAALIASGGVIGAIFPPSIPMVIYAVIANVSVQRMFLGGVVPGILFAIALMIYSYFFAKKRKYPKEEGKFDWKKLGESFKNCILALLMPIIILGGIFSGIFTATEAACVATMYAFVIGKFVYRTIEWKRLPRILLTAAKNTAVIMFIISSCSVLAWVITSQQIPQQMTRAIISMSSNPLIIVLLINAFVLVMATFMDAIALLVLLSPIMLSVLRELQIDPVFFGIVFVINICIGALTPPIGNCVFVASKIGGVNLVKSYKAVMPMVGLAVILLTICIIFPDIVMFLPNALAPVTVK